MKYSITWERYKQKYRLRIYDPLLKNHHHGHHVKYFMTKEQAEFAGQNFDLAKYLEEKNKQQNLFEVNN